MGVFVNRGLSQVVGLAQDTSTLPPQPVIPTNVVEVGMPAQSATVSVTGTLLSYVPIAAYANRPQGDNVNVNSSSFDSPLVGLILPDGTVITGGGYSASAPNNGLMFVYMLDPTSTVAAGTVITQILYWQLLTQAVVQANQPGLQTQYSVNYGVTQTQAESLSFTVGAQVGFDSTITGQLSTSITKSFSTSIAITNQNTLSQTFNFGSVAVEAVDGVYQLIRSFSVTPGTNLVNYIAKLQTGEDQICKMMGPLTGGVGCWNLKAQFPFLYSDNTYLQLQGVDQTSSAVKASVLSSAQIQNLAANSVKMDAAKPSS